MAAEMILKSVKGETVTLINQATGVNIEMTRSGVEALRSALENPGDRRAIAAADKALLSAPASPAVVINEVAQMTVIEGPDAEALIDIFFERRAAMERDAMSRSLLHYLDALRNALGRQLPYRVAGIGTLDLETVYVPQLGALPRPSEPEPIEPLLRATLEEDNVVFLSGAAGTGKSTLLSWLATRCWRDVEEWPASARRLPFWIKLRDLAESTGSTVEERLWAALTRSSKLAIEGQGPPPGFLDAWPSIYGAEWLFLFDGADEVAPEKRAQLLDWVAQVMEADDDRWAVVTSRFATDLEDTLLDDQASALTLLGLDHESESRLAATLLRGQNEAEFREAVSLSGLGDALSTPLFLTVAAGVFGVSKQLPDSRAALMAQHVDLLLGPRENPLFRDGLKALGAEGLEKPILAALGWEATVRNDASFAGLERHVVAAAIAPLRPDLGEERRRELAERVLDLLVERSGLLSRDPDLRFVHTLFREHFAAQHMVKLGAASPEAKRAFRHHEETWKGVLGSAFGLWSLGADARVQAVLDENLQELLWPTSSGGVGRFLSRLVRPPLSKRDTPQIGRLLDAGMLVLEASSALTPLRRRILDWIFEDPGIFKRDSCERLFLPSGHIDPVAIALRAASRLKLQAPVDMLKHRLRDAMPFRSGAAALLFDMDRAAARLAMLHVARTCDTEKALDLLREASFSSEPEAARDFLAAWLPRQADRWAAQTASARAKLEIFNAGMEAYQARYGDATKALAIVRSPKNGLVDSILAVASSMLSSEAARQGPDQKEIIKLLAALGTATGEQFNTEALQQIDNAVDLALNLMSPKGLARLLVLDATQAAAKTPLPEALRKMVELRIAEPATPFLHRNFLGHAIGNFIAPPTDERQAIAAKLVELDDDFSIIGALGATIGEAGIKLAWAREMIGSVERLPALAACGEAQDDLKVLVCSAAADASDDTRNAWEALVDFIPDAGAEPLVKAKAMAVALGGLGDWDGAVEALTPACALAPEDDDLALQLARAQILASDVEVGLTRAQALLARRPDWDDAIMLVVKGFYWLGRFRPAIAFIDDHLARSPRVGDLLCHRAECLNKLGLRAAALADARLAEAHGSPLVALIRVAAVAAYLLADADAGEEARETYRIYAPDYEPELEYARLVGLILAGAPRDVLADALAEAEAARPDDEARPPLFRLVDAYLTEAMAYDQDLLETVADIDVGPLNYELDFAARVVMVSLGGRLDLAEALIDRASEPQVEGLLRGLADFCPPLVAALGDEETQNLLQAVMKRISTCSDLGPSTLPAPVAEEPELEPEPVAVEVPQPRLPRQIVCYADAISDFYSEKARAGAILSDWTGGIGRRSRALTLWRLEDDAHFYGQTNFKEQGRDVPTKFVLDLSQDALAENLLSALPGWRLDHILIPDEPSRRWFSRHRRFTAYAGLVRTPQPVADAPER